MVRENLTILDTWQTRGIKKGAGFQRKCTFVAELIN